MSQLEMLYKLTSELHLLLNEEVTNQNRETVITKINELIEQREQAIKQVKPPFTQSENEIGKKVISMNKEIEIKLENIFSQLKQEMKQIQKQKKTNRSYINPYGPIKTIDGMYVDSKQ